MNLYKRSIIVISTALFALLALLAIIMTDLNDRNFPQAIGSESRLTLDFSESQLTIKAAVLKLEELDAHFNLGIIKMLPDITDNGNVFIALDNQMATGNLTSFTGESIGKFVGNERLSNSYPDGIYFVTRNIARLHEFEKALQDEGVLISRRDASVWDSLIFVLMERGFIIVIFAALALISALSLFWLSLKARGRALRVLGGCPTIRIHLQDFAGFSGSLLIAATIIAILSTSYVAFFHGWHYVIPFFKLYFSVQIVVIAFSLVILLIMSAATWPSATMLATRQSSMKHFRSVAMIIQAITFVLVISSVGPAWSTYQQAESQAANMAQWKKLKDQVALVFVTDLHEMDQMEPMIGEVVKEGENLGTVALSYTYTKEMWPSVDFHNYSGLAVVNQRWVELMTNGQEEPAIKSISVQDIPKNLIDELSGEIDILSRSEHPSDLFAQIQFFEVREGSSVPVAQGGGGGSLLFSHDILFAVVPSLYDSFNDFNLTSLLSSSNVIFTGVTETEQLLKRHHLDIGTLRENGFKGEVEVVYVAEEGLLQAQFATYLVWLQSLSLIALLIAFTVATAIRALITATLHAKRDFPLRLSGFSWRAILQRRIMQEVLVGLLLILFIVIMQNPSALWLIWLTAAYGLLIVPAAHLISVHWCFNRVRNRRI